MKLLKSILSFVLLCHSAIVAAAGTFQPIPESPFPTGIAPFDVAYTPIISGNEYVAVVNFLESTVTVYSVDQNSGVFSQIPGSPFPTGGGPTWIAFSPILPGNLLFAAIANLFDDTVSVYLVDPLTGAFTPVPGSPFPTGSVPISVAYSPVVSGKLYAAVANQVDKTVTLYLVDQVTGAFTAVGTFPTNSNSTAVAFTPILNGNTVYVALSNTNGVVDVYSLDTVTDSLTPIPGSPFPAGDQPNSIAISPFAGGNLFAAVTNLLDNTVSFYIINQSTGALMEVPGSPFPTGNEPVGVAFSPVDNDNLLLAVTNSSDSTVSLYFVNTSTGTLKQAPGSPFATGFGPAGVGFSPLLAGNNLFAAVTNSGEGTVSVYEVLLFSQPVSNLCGFQVSSKFLNTTEYVNVLTWSTPLTGPPPVAYKIFRNNLSNLIAVVPATGCSLKFADRNRKKGKLTTYFVESVDATGMVSAPVAVQVGGIPDSR